MGQPLKPPCRPGFSQNFYTVIVPRDVLHGQSILKGKSAASAAGYHLLTDDFLLLSSLHWCVASCESVFAYRVCVCARVCIRVKGEGCMWYGVGVSITPKRSECNLVVAVQCGRSRTWMWLFLFPARIWRCDVTAGSLMHSVPAGFQLKWGFTDEWTLKLLRPK